MSEITEYLDRKPIHILPSQIANQIAAGEVVERPASVLKEALENSVDASASNIEIELMNGGFSLIRVTDDGTGIPCEELALSLTRHATSKITTALDLEKIESLGFRGEALASIASVSKLTITSKTRGQIDAYQCRVKEGCDPEVLKAAHKEGTTLEVRDLFYNVPVRRKFLKSVKTEFECLDAIIKKMALSHYAIQFTLIHNQKKLRHYPRALTAAARLNRVQKILGEAFIKDAHEIDFEQNGLKLSGYFGALSSAGRHLDNQYFFVNQRPVRDKVILHAIKTAFHTKGIHLEGLHPAYVLYLELDPSEVDVNVHPTKQEVRFTQARWIHDFIQHCIVSIIEQGELIEQVNEKKSLAQSLPVNYSNSTPVYFEQSPYLPRDTALKPPQVGIEGAPRLLVFAKYYILSLSERLIIIDLDKSQRADCVGEVMPLLCPIVFSESVISLETQLLLKKIGFDFMQNIKAEWMITQVPKAHEAIRSFDVTSIESWFK